MKEYSPQSLTLVVARQFMMSVFQAFVSIFFLMKCCFNNGKKHKNSPIWLTMNETFVKLDCLLIEMQGQKVAKDKLKVLIATATAKAVTTCTLEQSGNSCLGSCLLICIKRNSKG